MALRDILMVLGDAPANEQQLALTLALAVRHGARVSGFCPLDLLATPRPAMELLGYGEAMATDQEATQPSTVAAHAEQLEMMFREELNRAGVAGAWHVGDADPPAALLRLAHQSDLIVFGQPQPEGVLAGRAADLMQQVLLEAGRPLLIVPYAGKFEALARLEGFQVLIGWTETREAARAVHDALPLLAAAGAVTVLTILTGRDAPIDGQPPAAELAQHLQRHGVAATAMRSVTDGIPDSDALLSYACDVSADLLVLGGYGHSPLRERMWGGVTRDVLRHMTLPVLMSH